MARIRSIHPGLLTDEAFARLTVECPLAVVLMLGLWMHADDSGTFEWKPLALKMKCLPATGADADELLRALADVDMVRRFDINGKPLGVIRNFVRWQRPKDPKDVYPFTAESRAYAGFVDGRRPRSATGRPSRDEPEDVSYDEFGSSSELGRQREEGGGRREEDTTTTSARAPELDLREARPLPTADPLEAEARELLAGLPVLADRNFAPIAALLGDGATRADVLAGLSDALAVQDFRPKHWRSYAGWVQRAAKNRADQNRPPTVAPPWRAGPAKGDLAVCLEIAGVAAPPPIAKPPPDALAAAALARCRPGVSRAGPRVEIGAAHAPSASERAALQARRAALDRALAPAGRDAARRGVAALFAQIPSGRARPEETREQIELFAGALEKMPGFALAEATAACLAAGAKFRPSSGELLSAATRIGAPLWEERTRIGELLGASVQAGRPSAEQRARQVAAFHARMSSAGLREGAA